MKSLLSVMAWWAWFLEELHPLKPRPKSPCCAKAPPAYDRVHLSNSSPAGTKTCRWWRRASSSRPVFALRLNPRQPSTVVARPSPPPTARVLAYDKLVLATGSVPSCRR